MHAGRGKPGSSRRRRRRRWGVAGWRSGGGRVAVVDGGDALAVARRWFGGGGREKAKSKICYRKNRALHATAADLSTRCAPRFFSLDLAQPRVAIPSDLAANLPLDRGEGEGEEGLRGPSDERRVRSIGVSLTRVRVCRAAWRRTVRNMCTIKYIQKCLLSLVLSCLPSSFSQCRARARIRGEYVACTRIYVHTGIRRPGMLSA